jgi:hypothetical protein
VKKEELILRQIIADKFYCSVLADNLCVYGLTPDQKLHLCHQYNHIICEAEFSGVFSEKQMVELLIKNGIWSEQEERELSLASAKSDSIKEEMYIRYESFQSKYVDKLRQSLQKLRIKIGELFKKRHSYDIYTSAGLAAMYQLHFHLLNNTFLENGIKLADNNPTEIYIRALAEDYITTKPDDVFIRQISKLDMWKSIWHSSKGCGSIFGIPSINLSDEQRSLIGWSSLYDAIAEAIDVPDEKVLKDDDLLDGWLIVQHKKREEDKKKKDGESGGPGNKEVFIPAETREDAVRIYGMNDNEGRVIQSQRLNVLAGKGRIREQDMPDSQRQILLQATREFNEKMKQRK